MGLFKRWSINLVFLLALVVYLLGLFVEIMDVDSAQYAVLSNEMLKNGSFFEVQLFGRDYLDKPPFLFWLTSVFYWIFGVHEWSFRLGSVLFSLVGVISTYKLGHLLYNKRIGMLAALMLMSGLAFIWMNHDVRTDTVLTSAVIFSVWKLTAFLYYNRKTDFIWGFVGIAIAMMTKGPIGLMVPALALGSYAIGRKRYRDLFRVEWLFGLIIVTILLLPMSLGLYQQFDSQPEKIVAMPSENGMFYTDSVSGLQFFFWEQSFGRLTGESVWSNDLGGTFFVHTFLWSFIPWSLLAVWALIWRIVVAIRDVIRKEKKQEWLTIGGFLLPLVALSFSGYKLPHYLNVLLPFAAIFTSEFVLRITFEKPKVWFRTAWILQGFNLILMATAFVLLAFVFFPETHWAWIVLLSIAIAGSFYLFFRGENMEKLIVAPLIAVLSLNIYMNGFFFPRILEYQPSDKVAEQLHKLEVPDNRFFIINPPALYSLAFYTDNNYFTQLQPADLPKLNNRERVYIYTRESGMGELIESGRPYELIEKYDYYHVTLLNVPFLNPKTRGEFLENAYLIAIDPI